MNNRHVELAKQFNYHPSLIYILEGCSEADLKAKYPQTYENLVSCQYAKDTRTILQYANDLINNWLFEDTIVHKLQEKGLDIKLSGEDKNREILKECKVGQTPDTEITFQGKKYYMEIIRNNTDYWVRTDSITSLRGKKLAHLFEHKALCLCVTTRYPKKYTILDFSKDIKVGKSFVNEGIGGKIQTPISLSENNVSFKDFSWYSLSSDIVSTLLKRE